MFDNLQAIRKAGFVGFKTIKELRDTKLNDVPGNPDENDIGVYLVLRLDTNPPVFMSQSIGGHFKKKNPTVSLADLQSNWVEGPLVIYVGKAGAPSKQATLRSRLKQYLSFGAGRPVGHWGGRLIWQLAKSEEFVICWKRTPDDVPREVEKQIILEFKAGYAGKRPFANLMD